MIRAARALAPALALLASGAAAQDMSAAEFEAYVTGRTMTYSAGGGAPYGIEEYREGRRVRWSTAEGTCAEGRWYEDEDDICFVYEGDPEPKCWRFSRAPSGLTARYTSDASDATIYGVERSDAPLYCLGPEVGV